jgi:hypothetical protein
MALVTLDRGYVHVAADLEDYLAFGLTAETETDAVSASYAMMASGRSRQINRVGRPRTMNWSTDWLTTVEAEWIRDHVGIQVLARDPFGSVLWGSYLTVTRARRLSSSRVSLSLVFTEVTYSEAV